MKSRIEGWPRLWLAVALPGPPFPRGPHGTCFSWERPGENSRDPVAKHRIGIMEVREKNGKSGFCVCLAPLPEVAQGPSVKMSALSQTLAAAQLPCGLGPSSVSSSLGFPSPLGKEQGEADCSPKRDSQWQVCYVQCCAELEQAGDRACEKTHKSHATPYLHCNLTEATGVRRV